MSSSKPPDWGFDALTSFWTEAGRVAAKAQETAGRAFADAFRTAPGFAATQAAPFPFTGDEIPGSGDLRRAAQAASELWTAATGLSGHLAAAGGRDGDAAMDTAFRAMTDPKAWLASLGGLDTMTATVADGPRLADLFQTERQQAQVAKAWLELRRRELEHQTLVLGAWMEAGQAFSRALQKRTDSGAAPLEGHALLALWTETANDILLPFQRSEKFLESQAATIRAASAFRLAMRSLAERWAEQFDLPTRTEIDELHRTVTELRRELRARPAAPAPTAPGKTKRRKSRGKAG